ncbi:patatin-domain-containing protein [Sodiomyces alkalinus F11]|uniref:Patatin-like phospholipase domain-containing protein n=1 Tax=Sodiomyces alkalinus (strain CBS 110278 / VKM F-3762 / F11) TaxID=1314773 RepID=A0A3N2PPE3_SODAK|nr:patatin-domain-containing protein [Sodiomyces alkalinus F11]ROT36304.1 patatin-domain-containing protein [Sodiomyces alkalinus F11]
MTDLLVNANHVPHSSSLTTTRPRKQTSASAGPLPASKRSTANTQPENANVALGALSRALKGTSDLVLSLLDGLTGQERQHRQKLDERRQILILRMQNAETRQQWQDAAEELDVFEHNGLWKLDPTTADYNPSLIEARLKDLDEARINCDIPAMLHQVRTALSRDLGAMGNVDLYRHCYVGTKELVERYVDSALQTIDALVEKSQYALPEGMSQRDVLESVLYARQSFGRSALLLSGGGTFGMSHIGVLKALFEVKLLPRIISGASAGSIVCSVMCTRTDEEIPQVIEIFPYGDLSVFDDASRPDGVFDRLRRLLTEGSWSDIKHLTRVMRGLLGDITFQEAYNRTRRILNICVSTESVYELPRLLNYVTAPNVMIWSAVAASCSVPLVFSAAPLLVKAPGTGEHMPWNPTPQRWIDGSVDNDLPMTRLAEMFNVNHFIVSQVNPHVVPFLAKDDQLNPEETDWVYTVSSLARDEALHRLQFLAELGIFPNLATKLRSVLSQKYSGDINILPQVDMLDLPRLLSNPTSDFMKRACLAGERATWPKLSRVRDRCAIELGLDRAVHQLRARVVFSESQVDLRRLAAGISAPPPRIRLSNSSGPSPPQHRAKGFTPDSPTKNRHRRLSGSSVQLKVQSRRLPPEDNTLTDEETEEEERLEMRCRREQNALSPALLLRKPRPKRSAKSQNHVYTTRPEKRRRL